MGNNQREGRIVVLPLSFAQEECERAGLDLHVSNVSVANKPDAEPAIGRLISDYSHPEGASMMFAGKKSLNKHVFTPIRNPTAADVCQLHANAMAAFPGEVIVAARLDISSAYNRIRLHPPSIPLGALYFRGADGVEYVAMPMVEWFGSQDSNFHWQLVAVDLAGRSSHRCWSQYGCALSAMYTDDFFLFGTREFVEAESARFSADAESAVGVGAINVKKTVSGSHIDIIGLANDTSAAHTIGMSATIFLKMVCAMFVMMPLELEAGGVRRGEDYAERCIKSYPVCGCCACHGPLFTWVFSQPAQSTQRFRGGGSDTASPCGSLHVAGRLADGLRRSPVDVRAHSYSPSASSSTR